MKLRWTLFLLLGLFLGTILAGKKPPRSKNKKPAFADCLTKCVKSLEGSLDHTKLFECSSQCEEQAGLKSKESPATLKEAMPSASSDTPPPVIKATSKPVVRTADETSESPPSLAKNEVPVAVKTAAPSTPAMEPILPVFAMQTGDAPAITPGADKNDGNELKLLLGAGANVDTAAMKGWVTVDVRDGLGVDHVMDARNLSLFNDESVSVIYAAHLLQTFHYRYNDEIMAVLKEWNRVLVPGGEVYISVPDMPTLCWLYLNPNLGVNARFRVLQIMLGTQEHVHDSHHAGFDINFLEHYLSLSGFSEYERVPAFSFFDDTSNQKILDTFISLNVIARKADESRQSSRRSQRI